MARIQKKEGFMRTPLTAIAQVLPSLITGLRPNGSAGKHDIKWGDMANMQFLEMKSSTISYVGDHFQSGGAVDQMSGGAKYLPKFLPISFFRRVSRFIGVSRHLALQ